MKNFFSIKKAGLQQSGFPIQLSHSYQNNQPIFNESDLFLKSVL